MPITFPDTKAESWADSVALRSEPELDGCAVPEFALLEIGGPNPAALALAVCFLWTLVALSILLVRIQPAAHRIQEVTLSPMVEAPELTAPAESAPASSPEISTPASPPPDQPQPEPLRPTPIRSEAQTYEPIPRELMESPPPPAPLQSEPVPRELMESPPPPVEQVQKPAAKAQADVPMGGKPQANASPQSSKDVQPLRANLAQPSPGPTQLSSGDSHNSAPATLGTLPLTQLVKNEGALAASLAALPQDQQRALPRVWIRVNAEWFQALPQTQEKLYFSFTTPRADTEVLAYSPAAHSFNLERPMTPLWQIRDGEQVPALAALRSMAARRLDVAPELVGLYTWHPPLLENALRMFVLERMQQMGARLGPRDVVTIRVASGSGGWVMNLEPILQTRN